MSKSTVVEWLISKLHARHLLTVDDEDYGVYLKIVNKAHEMFYDQITDAYENGENRSAEQYYNETYGKKD